MEGSENTSSTATNANANNQEQSQTTGNRPSIAVCVYSPPPLFFVILNYFKLFFEIGIYNE